MSHATKQLRYWSRAGSFIGMEDVARGLGHDLAPMLTRFGFSADSLRDPETRVSYNALSKLLEACAREWDCPNFGLRVAKVQSLNILGPIGLAARLFDTVGEALKALVEHSRLHSTGFDLRIDVENSSTARVATILLLPRPYSDSGLQVQALTLGVAKNIIGLVTGNPRFKLIRVHFSHASAVDSTEAQSYFGCPVDFNQEQTMLSFDAAVMGQATSIQDVAYAPIIRTYLDNLNEQSSDDMVESIRRLIGQLLPTGRCSREVVAACLNLHPRTLQRYLAADGTSFSKVLDQHRHALALDLVSRKVMPLAQIADALGFSSQSVFNQAFRRWTGSSPKRLGTSSGG